MNKREMVLKAAEAIEGNAVLLPDNFDYALIGYTIPEGTKTVLGVYDMTELVRGDIDPRCVHMTYTTLSLLGVPAVVRLGDALMMEYRQNWFTPAYLMAWPHFKRQIGRGNYPNSATVPKSSEPPEKPQEAAPEPPKEEPKELAPAVAETAPNCDENGQFSLF